MSRVIRVLQGDLTKGDALLLVNASNTNVALGSGVSAAIRRACGPGYQQKIREALEETYGGPMEPGQVLITDAGSHPRARWVAHAAVMDYREGFSGQSYPTERRIEVCCRNLWNAIEELPGPVSVAMVALGAGVGNLGLVRSVEIACRTLQEHLAASPESAIGDVTFFGYQLPDYLAMLRTVSRFFPIPPETIPEEIRRQLSVK